MLVSLFKYQFYVVLVLLAVAALYYSGQVISLARLSSWLLAAGPYISWHNLASFSLLTLGLMGLFVARRQQREA